MADRTDMLFQMLQQMQSDLGEIKTDLASKPCLPHHDCVTIFAGKKLTYRVLTALSVATVVLGCTLIMIEGPQALDVMLNILGKIK